MRWPGSATERLVDELVYDPRGRIVEQAWPARDGEPARTVTHDYAVGGNPLVNRVSDTTPGLGAVTATVDLLGRTVAYTDAWGHTTTTAFDQAGRVTAADGPVGTVEQTYDPGTGRHASTVLDGSTLATASYDPGTGRLAGVAYGNGATAALGYDALGRDDRVEVTDTAGTTGHRVTRSPAGRVTDAEIYLDGTGFVDANPGGDNYHYDPAGRLVEAHLPDAVYGYGYGPTSGCPADAAGANTNRTSSTIGAQGTVASCYDAADRLHSTSSIPAAEVGYDERGNTVRLGDLRLAYDAAGRHRRTESATHVTRYRRDALDRLAERVDHTRIAHVATTSAASSSGSTRPSVVGGL